MEVQSKTILTYQTRLGDSPYEEWYDSLKNIKAKQVIFKRINRVALGNLGDCKSLGASLFELRINFGPGYRVYFTQEAERIIILLCGGDKSTQRRDIATARKYYDEYRIRTHKTL